LAIRFYRMITLRVDGHGNQLLKLLSEDDQRLILPQVQTVQLAARQVLYESGDPITRLYFPNECVISLVIVLPDGSSVEPATVGNEGVIGVGGLLSGDVSFSRQVVQIGGTAIVMGRQAVLRGLDACPRLRGIFHAHADAFNAQLMQSVACNTMHNAEQRLARYLLSCLDRTGNTLIPTTHEFLAATLGVRRPTVSLVAQSLQTAGLIRYQRGSITVLDREGLEQITCPCYRIIADNYQRQFKNVR
jgi:CRP-like cAMP-binding protein